MSGIATLPIENPVLIFFIVLVIILFAPILLNRIRVPHIIGLIIAGVIIGPNGLNLLARDSSFEIFGNVGILYLMFLAGLEIDMYDFKKSKKRRDHIRGPDITQPHTCPPHHRSDHSRCNHRPQRSESIGSRQ